MSVDIPILKIGNLLLTTIQGELHDRRAAEFQFKILEAIRENDVDAVIIDVSMQEIVDSYVAGVLGETAKMTAIMNAQLVLVGLRPEVTLTIVEMGMDFEEMLTAIDVEDGLKKLGYALTKIEDPDDGYDKTNDVIASIENGEG